VDEPLAASMPAYVPTSLVVPTTTTTTNINSNMINNNGNSNKVGAIATLDGDDSNPMLPVIRRMM
jgi:hypothetical protein